MLDERPSKRQKLDACNDADLLLDLGSDDWADDLIDATPIPLSAEVPVEEEEQVLAVQGSQMDEDEYWTGHDEELLLAAASQMDPDGCLVLSGAAPASSQAFEGMFTADRNLPPAATEPFPSQAPPQEPFLSQSEAELDFDQEAPIVPPPGGFEMAFKTAGGVKLAAPSKEAMARAQRILASPIAQPQVLDTPPATPRTARLNGPLDSPTAARGQPTRAVAATVHPLSQMQNFTPSSSPAGAALSTPKRPIARPYTPQTGFQTPRAIPQPLNTKPFNAAATPSPALSQRSQRSQTPSSVFGPSQASSQKTQKTTIDLRMSALKASQALSQRPKFVPPFKNGQRPTERDLQAIQEDIRVRSQSQQLVVEEGGPRVQSQASQTAAGKKKWKSFFDLKAPKERVKWETYGLNPGLSAYSLRALDIPEEIIQLDSLNAAHVRFPVHGGTKGWGDTYKDLVRMGAIVITDEWVKNHWALIVWKLGGMVRAKPNELAAWWTFDAVWRQILYRYEKEVNRAQRSAVKRIQEQDSPAQSPMVLLVSQIFWMDPPPPPEPANGEQPLHIPHGPIVSGFELTDGWYRINATIDPVLAYAAKREKIKVGTKISITAARLEASREGTDVMEAQDKSSLSISGNSTCIAPWDAKLGFTNHTFVATLRSLSPEGGSAALLDLTILKMYPIGYREVGEEHKEKAPWNEVEEQARLVAWERKRREAGEQAQRQFETMLNRLADITERATTLRAHPAAEPRADFDVEELLDELAEAKTLAALSTLDKPQLNEIIELGNERIQGLQNDAQTHIAEEMESICPQPKISNFRILQVRDSIASDFGMEGQLTVYSALNYEGEFAVGNRYWVTNVKPRGGSWSKSTAREGEVFIMAGAGSRFMKRPAI